MLIGGMIGFLAAVIIIEIAPFDLGFIGTFALGVMCTIIGAGIAEQT
jgi:hypothetical protein